MTSLMIVLVIKALVSPHSTPTAYIAVIFQGVTGALIYRFIPHLLISSVFFLSLGLIESALQRVFTLTILYGNTLWDAVNIWGEWVTKRWSLILPMSSSELIVYTYLLIHLVAGILVGWFVFRTIKSVSKHWGDHQFLLQLREEDKKEFFLTRKSKKKKWRRYLLFVVLIVVFILAYSGLNNSESNLQKGLIAIIRAVSILTIWFVFLAPLLIRFLQKFLKSKHQQLSAEVAQTMDLFPHLLWILDKAWKESKDLKWFQRGKSFMIYSLLYILQFKSEHDPDTQRTDAKL
jgi:hypothetical protein